MRILEYGDSSREKIILIHGFESPYQIWDEYIKHYETDYYVIVPILTGHDIESDADFVSFDNCVNEFEDYYINKFGNSVYAVYGMSMGGVFACKLWLKRNIVIDKLILESSPLLSYGKILTAILTKQYLNITHKAQRGNARVVKQAVNTMVTQDKLNDFLTLLNHISDNTIRNCIRDVGQFKLPTEIDLPNTKIYYYYGGKPNEFLFKRVASFIEKNYKNSETICLGGKGHCEDALLHPSERMKELDRVL